MVTARWIDLIHPLDVGLIKTTTTPKITSPEQGKSNIFRTKQRIFTLLLFITAGMVVSDDGLDQAC